MDDRYHRQVIGAAVVPTAAEPPVCLTPQPLPLLLSLLFPSPVAPNLHQILGHGKGQTYKEHRQVGPVARKLAELIVTGTIKALAKQDRREDRVGESS